MTTKEAYFEKFEIDREKAVRRAIVKTPNGITTAMTEMLGEKIIKVFSLWDRLFPENNGYKRATSKKMQKSGVDFEIFTDNGSIYIDLKVCVGPDYSMSLEDYNTELANFEESKAIPVEIYQNGIFTNSNGKLTDYMLYIIADSKGISYLLISYKEIQKISYEHRKQVENLGTTARLVNKGQYKWHKSNNGTGIYVKVPIKPVKLTH